MLVFNKKNYKTDFKIFLFSLVSIVVIHYTIFLNYFTYIFEYKEYF